mgnify:FL=1
MKIEMTQEELNYLKKLLSNTNNCMEYNLLTKIKECLGEMTWNKNTIDLNKFIYEDIAVSCDTKEKAEDFLYFLSDKGYTWASGSSLKDTDNFNSYGSNTAYDYDIYGITYSTNNHYETNNFIIISWEIV